ncbi:MAG: HAD hydrolase-like protein [Anaerovoracaceae bacterium]|jgi:phosphoglycolate phosphatase
MLKHYPIILWDLDGTIINSYEGVTKSVQYAASSFGIRLEDPEILSRFIGPPLRESFPKYCGFNEEETERAVEKYRERYNPIGCYECRLYDGAQETIHAFREDGRTQMLASSKPEPMCRRILEKFGIDRELDDIVGASMDGRIDTKIEVLNEVFRRLRQRGADPDPEKIVLIGDTRFDVIGAKKAGIDCIGVSYGFGSDQEMIDCGAVTVCRDLKELKEKILGS